MRFGHLMLCDQREGEPPQRRYEEMMEEVRLMDELGYWSVWFAEPMTIFVPGGTFCS